jgi:hypothetical protein
MICVRALEEELINETPDVILAEFVSEFQFRPSAVNRFLTADTAGYCGQSGV